MFEINIERIGELNERDDDNFHIIGAIETIYNFLEDRVIFIWDDMEFTALLSGDISDSWLDIIGLMKNLKSDKKEFDMQFPSQTFWHYWTFKTVDNDYWEMEAYWGMKNRKKIKVLKGVVKNEFQKLINMVEADLKKQKYKLEYFDGYLNKK